MFFIFVLISFAALFDDMTLKVFGKSKRKKALFLGCATLIAAIVVEDFAWFVNRWLVPLDTDPKGGQLMQYSDGHPCILELSMLVALLYLSGICLQ
jgi:hypothetical protein